MLGRNADTTVTRSQQRDADRMMSDSRGNAGRDITTPSHKVIIFRKSTREREELKSKQVSAEERVIGLGCVKGI
jgi:hypothetical protein